MPNRIIKESICYSDDIDRMTAFEETVFYRLLVRVDDYGRIDARPNFLKSMLFVTKNGVSEKNVSEAVARMASLGLVRFYEVDGKPFLCLPKWHLHQRVRDSKAKYPEPPQETDENISSPQLAATRGEPPLAHAPGGALDSDKDKDSLKSINLNNINKQKESSENTGDETDYKIYSQSMNPDDYPDADEVAGRLEKMRKKIKEVNELERMGLLT